MSGPVKFQNILLISVCLADYSFVRFSIFVIFFWPSGLKGSRPKGQTLLASMVEFDFTTTTKTIPMRLEPCSGMTIGVLTLGVF